jgi:hypothetical protein
MAFEIQAGAVVLPPPQWLDPAVPGFELPALALELPFLWLYHPDQPNAPLSTRPETKQTPQLQ